MGPDDLAIHPEGDRPRPRSNRLARDEPVHPLDTYHELLIQRGVPPGEIGTHLPSLILYSPRKVLEDVGGFPLIGSTYREAVATEIGISRIIQAKGYRISKVKDHSFH